MLIITFFMLLLAPTIQNGVITGNTVEQRECMDLIKRGGDIACKLTGQGNYRTMSVSNCWVSCTTKFAYFSLPHRECERIFGVESWAGFQEVFKTLPPYGYENCDDEDKETLTNWVHRWTELRDKSKDYSCSKDNKVD
uniref:Putative ixodes 10 kDa peptide protein n=1 Tax=Ixodes ricinus TaxID=34613 RepID=A0A0K8RCE4_IXORI